MKTSIKVGILLVLLLISLNLSAQEYQWAHSFGSNDWEEGLWVDYDSQGNIYTIGYFYGTIDFDPSNNVANLTSNGEADIFVASYDANGNYRWAFNIGGSRSDIGMSVAVYMNSIYITGYFQDTADFDPSVNITNLTSMGSADILLSSYDTDGNFRWANSYGSNQWDSGSRVKVDQNGNPIATGGFRGTVDFDLSGNTATLTEFGSSDIWIAKYDTDGNYQWAVNPGGSMYDTGNGITSDNNGNVYVIGNFQGTIDADPSGNIANLTSNGLNDISVLSYDPAGNYRWGFNVGGTGSDVGWSITHQENDMGDMIFTTGQFELSADFDPSGSENTITSNGQLDIFLGGYHTNGNHAWAFGVGGTGSDGGYSIDAEQNDFFYATGWYNGSGDFDPSANDVIIAGIGGGDTFLSKYRFDGQYRFAQVVGGPDIDFGNGVAAHNPVYVIGEYTNTVDLDYSPSIASLTSNGQADIFIAKYSSNPLAVDASNLISESFSLDQNYPNPFNPTTTIEYNVPHASHVTIEIFDVKGKLINTIVNSFRRTGTYSINWDGKDYHNESVSSGTYVYRLRSNGEELSEKMILLK